MATPPPPPPAAPPAPAAEKSSRTQVTLAVLSLCGVLGAALLANWDKVFRPAPAAGAAKPGAGSTQGGQSPVVSGVTGNVTIQINEPAAGSSGANDTNGAAAASIAGRWTTGELPHPYQRDGVYALQFEFEPQGARVLGRVTTVTLRPLASRVTRPIVDGRIEDGVLSFRTPFDSLAGGTTTTHHEHYLGRIEGGELRMARHNDVPSGGETERFIARRP